MAARWKKIVKVGAAAGAAGLGAVGAVYISALVQHDQRKEARQQLLTSKVGWGSGMVFSASSRVLEYQKSSRSRSAGYFNAIFYFIFFRV